MPKILNLITQNTQDLERFESEMREDSHAFYRFGCNLIQIRDRELYLLKNGGIYQTFEAYCKNVWDFNRSYAYRLMDSAKVITSLSPTGIQKPDNERQTRPLARLEPDQQREAWQKAVETAPEGKVTAAHVSKVVNELTGNIAEKKEKEIIKKSVKVEQIDPEFNEAWESLFRVVKNLKALKWKRMSRDNALRQIQILIDVIEI